MAELLFFREGELQMRAAIRQDRVSIGRMPTADFFIPDRAVSRQQCEIIRRGAGYVLVDLSRNGTRVGRREATENGTALKDGDEISLGAFSLVFSATDAPPAPEATARGQARSGRTAVQRMNEPPALRTVLRMRRPEGEAVVPLRTENGFSIVIGTDPRGTVQLVLKDSFVSASHCRISFKNDRWVLADLNSRNGTFVDGLRVIECVLAGRASLRLGETLIQFDQEFADDAPDQPLPGLVSHDPSMRPLVELVRRIAPSNVPVAIHGETGAGKEVIANAIHQLSARCEGPFVALNCGALPRDTVESELFGHERGAFTGADRARPGAFAEANGGTLFLDEIGDLPLAIQVKLLRVLERGEVRRLGGSRTERVDVRLVSATHRDLMAAVGDGSFREDLYYRLCVAPVELPPLRQRRDDIVMLARYFIGQLTAGQGSVDLDASARTKLEGHAWPGNVRELRNVIQLALLTRTGGTITGDDIILRAPQRAQSSAGLPLAGRTLDEIEREAYRQALIRNGGDRRASIEELGVSRATFFRKLAEFGLSDRETG